MRLRLEKFPYRFAEQVLNSKLNLKQEIDDILTDPGIDISNLSRPHFNKVLDDKFSMKGWDTQPSVFDEPSDPSAKRRWYKPTFYYFIIRDRK